MLLILPPYLAVHAETPAPPPAAPAPTGPPADPKPETPKTEVPAPTVPAPAGPEAPPPRAAGDAPKVDTPPPAPSPAAAEAKPAQEPGIKAEPQSPAPSAARFKSELPSPRPGDGPQEADPVSTEEEIQFVAMVNEERVRRGLSHLRIDPLLIRVARRHSAEMRDKAYFSHESPTEGIKTPLDRYLQLCSFRPAYACVGENLFWATLADVKRGHQAFMNSPTHRENVLFPRYERIGVGIVKRGAEFWVTQMYVTNTDPVTVAKNRMIR